MFDIGELFGRISIGDNFSPSYDKFSEKTKEAEKQSVSFTDAIKNGVGIAIGERLVGAAEHGLHAIEGMLDGLLKLGDITQHTSDAFGVSTDAVQKFAVAGAAVGVSGEQITAGVRKLQNSLAVGNDEVLNAVKFLGLSTETLKSMKPEEQFQTILEHVSKIPNAMDRTAVATQLLGRAGAFLAPLGNNIHDVMQRAEDLGIVMDKKTIANSERLGTEIGLLSQTFDGLKNNFVSVIVNAEPLHVLISGLTDILGELSVWVKQNQEDLQSFVEGGVVFVAEALVQTINVIEAAAAGFKALADVWTVTKTAAVLLFEAQNALTQSLVLLASGRVLDAAKVWQQYGQTAATALESAQKEIASHQEKLNAFTGVADNVKNKFEVLRDKVIAAAGAQHTGADEADRHTKSLFESAASAKAAAAAAKLIAEAIKKENEAYDAFFLTATKVLHDYEQPIADALTRETTARMLLSTSLRANAKDFGVLADEINKQRRAASEAMGGSGQLVSEIKIAGEETMKFWSRDPKVAAELAANGGKLFGAALTKSIGEQLAENLPQAILGAIQGGGNVFQAIGSSLGSTIFGKDSGFTKGATKFLTDNLGDTFGKAFGSLIPGIGALAGPLLGKLGGLIGNLFGGEGKKVNDMRDQFISAAGGLDALNKKAHEAGMTLDQLLAAKKVTDFQAAVDKLNLGFSDQAKTQEFLNSTIEKYGFTVDQLGPAFARQQLTQQAQSLLDEYTALIASGISHANVIEKMGDNFSDFVNKAVASNQELPDAMRPMIDELFKAGKLVHENGEAFTEAEKNGLKFGSSLEVSVGKIADQVERLVNALLGIPSSVPPIDIPLNPRWLNGDGGGPRDMPHFAVGGVVTSPTVGLFGENGPEAIIPLDQLDEMLTGGGGGPDTIIVQNSIGSDRLDTLIMRRMHGRFVRVPQ